MTTCRELIEFLDDYASGDLPEAQRLEFERHMEDCPPCGDYLQNYISTIRLGKEAYRQIDEEACKDVPERLVQAILAARKKR